MKRCILALAFSFGHLAFAAKASPGMKAFASISPAGNHFTQGNFRAGCQAFGQYLAYKSMADSTNTDQWTLRNLTFGEQSEQTIADFCSSPQSRVSKEKAAQAAESISSNVGLE